MKINQPNIWAFLPFLKPCIFLILIAVMGCKRSQEPVSNEYIQGVICEANRLVEDQNAMAAIELLEQSDCSQAPILEALAIAYKAANQTLRAAQTFEKVSYLDPDFQENALYAAEAYEQMQDLHSTARCYRFYLESFPHDEVAWLELSNVEMQLSHFLLALQYYLKSVENTQGPLTFDQCFHLSQLCYAAGKRESALYWGQEALNLEPKACDVYLHLLCIADEQKNQHLAESLLQSLDAIDPEYLTIQHFDNFRQQYGRKVLQEAKNEEKKVISRDIQKMSSTLPEIQQTLKALNSINILPVTLTNLSYWYLEPQTYWNKVHNYNYCMALGNYYESQRDFIQACNYYRIATQRAPKNAEAWYALAYTYYQDFQWQAAELALQNALYLAPNEIQYTILHLKILQKTCTPQAFIAAIKKARNRFPQNYEITLLLARTYHKLMHDVPNAIEAYQDTLKLLPPDHPESVKIYEILDQLTTL